MVCACVSRRSCSVIVLVSHVFCDSISWLAHVGMAHISTFIIIQALARKNSREMVQKLVEEAGPSSGDDARNGKIGPVKLEAKTGGDTVQADAGS